MEREGNIMAAIQGQLLCQRCNRWVVASRQSPNHILHLILAVLTGGLWIIPWLCITGVANGKGFRCQVCGWEAPATDPYAAGRILFIVIWGAIAIIAMVIFLGR